jgi:hypothetical protein
MKPCMYVYIIASEPISTAYFISPSLQSVSLCIPPIVARQWLDKNITVTKNTHATIEEFLDSFSMR